MIKKKILLYGVIVVSILISFITIGISKNRTQIELIINTKNMVVSAYDTYGNLPVKFENVISAVLFKRICFRSEPRLEEKNIVEKYHLSDWCAVITDNKATVRYTYTYSQREKNTGNPLTGSLCIPCELYYELVDGAWVVVAYKEAL